MGETESERPRDTQRRVLQGGHRWAARLYTRSIPLAGAVLTLFRVVLKVIAEGAGLVVGDVLP